MRRTRSNRTRAVICRSAPTADVAVLRLEKGSYGFIDSFGGRMKGTERLTCEMTMRDGKVVYDLNGLAATDWTQQPRR